LNTILVLKQQFGIGILLILFGYFYLFQSIVGMSKNAKKITITSILSIGYLFFCVLCSGFIIIYGILVYNVISAFYHVIRGISLDFFINGNVPYFYNLQPYDILCWWAANVVLGLIIFTSILYHIYVFRIYYLSEHRVKLFLSCIPVSDITFFIILVYYFLTKGDIKKEISRVTFNAIADSIFTGVMIGQKLLWVLLFILILYYMLYYYFIAVGQCFNCMVLWFNILRTKISVIWK
jgi:hypothetical protein